MQAMLFLLLQFDMTTLSTAQLMLSNGGRRVQHGNLSKATPHCAAAARTLLRRLAVRSSAGKP